MKFDNTNHQLATKQHLAIKLFAVCCLTTWLSACTTGPKQAWDYDGSKSVALVNTSMYLPIQQRDETGQVLPYEAKPNPYNELGGRIDKTAVTTYIDARRAYQAKKYDFADKLLADLSQKEPKLSGPWVMRGDIAAEQNKLQDALGFYAKAVEVNSINFNAYLRLAKVQRQLGHFNHAQNTYAKALALWSDGPELHLNLGVLYDVYLNQPKLAQAHMEAYQLLAQQKNADAQQWLSEVKARTGVQTALQIKNAKGEVEMAQSQSSATPNPTTSDNGAGSSESEKLAASKQ